MRPVVKICHAMICAALFVKGTRQHTVFKFGIRINLHSYLKQCAVHKQNVTGEEVVVESCRVCMGNPRYRNNVVEVIVKVVGQLLVSCRLNSQFGQTFVILCGNASAGCIKVPQGGIEVLEITDVTPLPHNGCRPPKRRRV